MINRLLLRVGMLAAVALGLLFLNYTKAFGVEEHMAWAQAHQVPAPSYEIFLAGAALTAFFACALGYHLGRPRPR
jgi:hypothetical protein